MILAVPITDNAFILKIKVDSFDASEIKTQTPSPLVLNEYFFF